MVQMLNQCASCTHKDICRYTNLIGEIRQSLNELKFKDETGKLDRLCDISFLEQVAVKCKYYKRVEETGFRGDLIGNLSDRRIK